jgi:hypothetical protein
MRPILPPPPALHPACSTHRQQETGPLSGHVHAQRHVRVLSVQRGLDKYAGSALHLVVGAHDGGNGDGAMSRPNKRAPTRRYGRSSYWLAGIECAPERSFGAALSIVRAAGLMVSLLSASAAPPPCARPTRRPRPWRPARLTNRCSAVACHWHIASTLGAWAHLLQRIGLHMDL